MCKAQPFAGGSTIACEHLIVGSPLHTPVRKVQFVDDSSSQRSFDSTLSSSPLTSSRVQSEQYLGHDCGKINTLVKSDRVTHATLLRSQSVLSQDKVEFFIRSSDFHVPRASPV
jgi:hypothetical protein